MFTLGTTVSTPAGQGTLAGAGTTAKGDPTIVIDISGRMIRFTGSDLYRISAL